MSLASKVVLRNSDEWENISENYGCFKAEVMVLV